MMLHLCLPLLMALGQQSSPSRPAFNSLNGTTPAAFLMVRRVTEGPGPLGILTRISMLWSTRVQINGGMNASLYLFKTLLSTPNNSGKKKKE